MNTIGVQEAALIARNISFLFSAYIIKLNLYK